jgi:aspartate carbamoyltransferase catalytic subunit
MRLYRSGSGLKRSEVFLFLKYKKKKKKKKDFTKTKSIFYHPAPNSHFEYSKTLYCEKNNNHFAETTKNDDFRMSTVQ